MNWKSGFIDDIDKRRKSERESAPEMAQREDNLLKLISKSLYGEKVHYALELIQNAEDSFSSSITFIFESNMIIVINDGEVFTFDDVEAICSVKPGRKKNKIGFFGVGFKSVFNITNTPQVISSYFNFQIENYIYPKPIETIPQKAMSFYSPEKGSIFVLPQSEGLPSTLELIENFKEIDDKILLFLDDLKVLHFIDNINNERWSIEKPPLEGGHVILQDGRNNLTSKWIVFNKDLSVSDNNMQIPEGKEGITQTRIIVAFPADEISNEMLKGAPLYCYLPTNKRSDMPFLVQADFVPTVGRGSIQELDWNKWLLKEIGILAAEAIDSKKEDIFFVDNLYRFIPLKQEVKEPLMNIVSEAMHDLLKTKSVGKTLELVWKKPSECIIAEHPLLQRMISQKDLNYLFGKSLSFIDMNAPKRASLVLSELGALTMGINEFVKFLGKEHLVRKRKPVWFLDAYFYLSEVFDVGNRYWWGEEEKETFSQLEKTKFIQTSQGDIVPLKDPEKPDMLICYPHGMDLSEVNALFSEGEIVFLNKYFQLSTIIKRKESDLEQEEKRKKVHEFFEAIGVRSYFKQSHVIKDIILRKFSSGKYKQYGDLKIYRILNYIRVYWPTLESEVKNKKLTESIFSEIRNTIHLRCYSYKNNEKVFEYMPPNQIYFSKRYGSTQEMETLFSGISKIYFLDPYYINRIGREGKRNRRGRQREEYGWKKFAEMLGVWSFPRVDKNNSWISISDNPSYDWVEKQYSPQKIHEIYGDSISDDIKKLIEYYSFTKDADTTRSKMTILFHSLANNWKEYKQYIKSQYRYYHHSYKPINLDSTSFLNYLRKASWIPTINGDFCKPDETFIQSKRNLSLLGDRKKYIGISGNPSFLKDIGVNLEPSVDEVIEHLKEYKETNPNLSDSKLEKFDIIYSFLAEKIDNEPSVDIQKIKNEFSQHHLFYLPIKSKSWWRPEDVFLKDYSRIFGNLRGYIELDGKEIYSSRLKTFVQSLGVREFPSISQALDVLAELGVEGDLSMLKGIVVKVYAYIDDRIGKGNVGEIEWQKYSFLTRNDQFYLPNYIFYDDEEEYSKYFINKVEFIYLPLSSNRFSSFLMFAGFKSFSENITIKKHLGRLSEMEGSEASNLINALCSVENYLIDRNFDLYERLKLDGIFNSLSEIDVYETPEIHLEISLQNDTEVITVADIEKEAFFSQQEKRLYVLGGTKLLSGNVAKELSRIFKGAEKDVFPFLNSILPVAHDESSLQSQLFLFGIREKEELYASPEKPELLQTENELTKKEDEDEKEDQTGTQGKDFRDGKKKPTVKPPVGPEPHRGFIKPERYFPSKKEEYIPFTRTEGQGPCKVKEVNLKNGAPDPNRPSKEPPLRIGRIDAEGIAIQMVLNYEASEGREAEDRHNQKGIGYDVYSKRLNGEEIFIEIKHFGELPGKFKLTPHQLKKAAIDGDKYFVYIVSGLKEGSNPKKLYIIQNPVKWIIPDPPIEQEYSDWESGVKEEITFENV